MCGRISLYSDPDYLARIFDAQLGPDVDPDARPSWNVPPTRSILAVADVPDVGRLRRRRARRRRLAAVHRELGRYRWGLVPSWAKDPAVGSRMFNARAETVASKPSFRAAFTARRLVVVADGFYEWRPGPGAKQPLLLHPVRRPAAGARRTVGAVVGWSGQRVTPRGAERPPMRTCTVITTEAGPDMGDIHHRMPVVLEHDMLDEWLDPANRDKPELESLLVPPPPAPWSTDPVGPAVGNVRNDGPELTEAVAD